MNNNFRPNTNNYHNNINKIHRLEEKQMNRPDNNIINQPQKINELKKNEIRNPIANYNAYDINKQNTNKFVSNINPSKTMNFQERAINFGQDANENIFKRTLRKPQNPVVNAPYNIITGQPYTDPYLQNKSNIVKKDNIDDLFYTYKSNSNPLSNSVNLTMPKSSQMINKIEENKVQSKNNIININNNNPLNLNPYNTSQKNTLEYQTNSNSQTYFTAINKYEHNTKEDFFQNEAISVKDYAYKQEQNIRYRATMEDMGRACDKFMGDPNKGLFILLDGHGGEGVARYALGRLPAIIEKCLLAKKETETVESAISTAFNKVDEEIKFSSDLNNTGATATIAYITKEKDYTGFNSLRKVIYCANVGDSRCVVVSSYTAKRLSYDHKANDVEESKRILNSGGIIFGGRVYGQLILTRALGDHNLKPYGVTSTPSISKYFISDKDKYLVLASDGVWDVLSDDDIYKFSYSANTSNELSQTIVKNALIRGSQDNISCLSIKL